MKNDIILQNCKEEKVPHYEHDDHLYLTKREEMTYNVEKQREKIIARCGLPKRGELTYEKPLFSHSASKHQSSLMYRWV